jgi:hypothetical protein
MANQLSEDMRRCIEQCLACHSVCTEMVTHCLEKSGKYADVDQIRLLLDCAEICRTSAGFMMRGSDLHALTCGVCAEVCERCAIACEKMADDPAMKRCAEECRRCAVSCRQMASAMAG